MLQGEQSAILRLPPAPTGSSEPTKATKTTVSAGASTAAIALSTPAPGSFYTFKARTGDITIVFGDANVVAATANDMCILAGTSEDWWIPPNVTHFRAYGLAAADLHWARSGA